MRLVRAVTTNEDHLHHNVVLHHHADCCRNIGNSGGGKGKH
jgi:hypothetical protein